MPWTVVDVRAAARTYNNIPLFESQRKNISPAIIEAAAAIFVKHHQHAHFGLNLLHRHNDISTDQVMVHSRPRPDKDLCLPCQIGSHTIQPCALRFHIGRRTLIPVEYDEMQATDEHFRLPDSAFLSDMEELLVSTRMEAVLGFSRIPTSSHTWVESVLPDRRGTVAHSSEVELSRYDGVVTEWSFSLDDGNPGTRAIRARTIR
jgi:hypothetical protein